MDYPYSTPQLLTDQIFVEYGGQTGTSTVTQRQAAYLIAEGQMTEHLSSPVVPTIISGTAFYRGGTLFETEYGRVSRVLLFSSNDGRQERSTTGTVLIRNSEFGYLDVFPPCYYGYTYRNTVVYEAGLPTGIASGPIMLSALSLAAQIQLNEWDPSLSNEGVGDVGVQTFSNLGYSEVRTKLGRTAFGNSALAQRVANLVRKYRTKPGASFR